MIETLPEYISAVFIGSTIITLIIFYWTIKNSRDESVRRNALKIITFLLIWLLLQAFLSIQGFYIEDLDSVPPGIFLGGILPNILIILWLFLSKIGKRFMDSLPKINLAYLNLVRIPVEFVLLWLFLNNTIPGIMTFEGWNFDILMGLSAPIVIYFGFIKRRIPINGILIWNIIGILLLFFIFIIALLSAPFPLQKLAFEQPNIGLLYFPFSWLPTFIVPVVMLGHLATVRQTIKNKRYE